MNLQILCTGLSAARGTPCTYPTRHGQSCPCGSTLRAVLPHLLSVWRHRPPCCCPPLRMSLTQSLPPRHTAAEGRLEKGTIRPPQCRTPACRSRTASSWCQRWRTPPARRCTAAPIRASRALRAARPDPNLCTCTSCLRGSRWQVVRRGDGSAHGGALALVAEELHEKAARLSHCGARADLIAPPRRALWHAPSLGPVAACVPAYPPPSDAAPSSVPPLVVPPAIFRSITPEVPSSHSTPRPSLRQRLGAHPSAPPSSKSVAVSSCCCRWWSWRRWWTSGLTPGLTSRRRPCPFPQEYLIFRMLSVRNFPLRSQHYAVVQPYKFSQIYVSCVH